MRVVVVYDISDNDARNRVAKTLESWGLSRIQRSAFEGSMQLARARDLARRLEKIVDPDSDVIHIFFIQPQDWRKTIVVGKPAWVVREVEGARLLY